MTAKSTKLIGPQSPIIYALDVAGYSYRHGNLSYAGDASITGKISSATMNVSSNVAMPGYLFAAGLVSSAGSKLSSTGQVSWSVARTSGYPVGAWQVTFASAHPLGGNYMILATAQGGVCYISIGSYAPSSTKFALAIFTMGTATTLDCNFSFMVLAS